MSALLQRLPERGSPWKALRNNDSKIFIFLFMIKEAWYS